MGVKLDVEISGNAAGFATALNKAKADAKTFASDVSGGVFKNFNTGFAGVVNGLKYGLIGAASALPLAIYAAFREVEQRSKDIKLGSIRTGLDTSTFQHVQNVTESADGSMGEVAHAFDHIAKVQQEIKAGSVDTTKDVSKLQDAFVALGVSLADLDKASPQALFFKIAASLKDAAAAGKLTGEQTAALMEVLGKSGNELLPVFAKGFAGETRADWGNLDADTLKGMAERKAREAHSLTNAEGVGGWWKSFFASQWARFDKWNEESDPLLKARREMENPTQEGEDSGPAFARRQNQNRWRESDRATIDQQRAAKDNQRFGEEAKKIEAEIAAEKLKQGTPEERRLALLGDIKRHEQEIADIRMYQEAGAFSETEARKRIDLEELDILKRKGALKQLERGDKTEADKWVKLGAFDRDIYKGRFGGIQRSGFEIPGINIPANAEPGEPGFAAPGVPVAGAQPQEHAAPRVQPEDFIGPQPESFDDAYARLQMEQIESDRREVQRRREADAVNRQMTSPLGSNAIAPLGSTVMTPSAGGESEAQRQTQVLLETANRALERIAFSQQRLTDSLA